jgi:hypothetical protein
VQPNEISEVLNRPMSQELLARDLTRLSNMATVEPRSAGPVDCRISADAVAFILVVYGPTNSVAAGPARQDDGPGLPAMASLRAEAAARQPIARALAAVSSARRLPLAIRMQTACCGSDALKRGPLSHRPGQGPPRQCSMR